MTESRSETEKEALKDWFKPLLDKVVQEMLKRNAVTGTAVEASPAWAFPNKILIAKVWGMGQKTRFIWTISGEGVITDYIAGSMAATPKDAAKHFALKWQMDADRLLAVGKNKGPTRDAQLQMGNYANKLIKDAESLYDLTNREEVWL
ncbi:MAG: DUF4826 family protein [Lysobacterales bacterium]|jgi:hypothetical protein